MNNPQTMRSESFQDRFLLRVLEYLQKDLNAAGLSIRQGGEVLLSTGKIEGESISFEFGDYELFIGKSALQFSSRERGAINSARQLIALTLPSIRSITRSTPGGGEEVLHRAAGLPVNTWIDSLLQLMNTLSQRSHILKTYENILNLSQQILLAKDLFAVLQLILDAAKEAIGGEGASILLVDQKTGEMYFNVISGENENELREVRIPAGQGIAGSVVKNGKAEIVVDASRDKRIFNQVDEILNKQTRNMVIAPIVARGVVTGVIEVINSLSPDGFFEEDRELLSHIAYHTGLLIENAKSRDEILRSNAELDRRNTELNALYEIGKVLKSTMNFIEMKTSLLRTLVKVLKIEDGALLIPDEKNKNLVTEHSCSLGAEGVVSTDDERVYAGVGDILTWMKENREPFYFLEAREKETEGGLLRRFRTQNTDLFLSGQCPEIWIPIFDRKDGSILFVLSFRKMGLRQKSPVEDIAFFGSIMDQTQTGFYNIETYNEAIHARKREMEIRQTFQKYVPARIVEDILDQANNPKPREQTVSVLFLDVRNYTSIAEYMEPAKLVDLLNEFFEDMVEPVMKHGGIIDKFIGDAMMALFGVPDPSGDDAKNGLLATVEIVERLERLNAKRESNGRTPFEVGISLHTGPVIVGNVGSRRRMDYTAVGDTVNLASRLEKATTIYRTPFVFTEETLKALSSNPFTVRELDVVQVRGRETFTRIFEMVRDEKRGELIRQVSDRWSEALDEYRKRNFRIALSLFTAIRSVLDFDAVTELYIIRCLNYLENPPESGWEGIFQLDF